MDKQNGKPVAYDYNDLGQAFKMTYPNTPVLTREIDVLGRIKKIMEGTSGPEIASFGYAGRGLRMLSKNYMNGNTMAYTHDTSRRLTQILAKKNVNDLIEQYVYKYNKVGMKMYERRAHESDTGDQYAYDSSYRLMQVKKGVPGAQIENPNATTFSKKRDYLLDSVENIIKITTTLPNNQTSEIVTEMSTANAKKLHQYNKYDGWVLEYDGNGNTTRKINQFFIYNFKNQLVQVTGGGQPTITYKYDALGRRIEKSSTSSTEKFYYAGNQVIEVRNGSDQITKQFVYGNGIDEPVRMDLINGGNTTPYYYHTNQIGSITAITDSTGALVERIKYDDYGKPTFTDYKTDPNNPVDRNYSIIGNNILFQGREYEPEINLYYYRARYYDPAMGRFLQTDPVGYADSMNLYQAMNQNPVNYWDPFGEWWWAVHNEITRKAFEKEPALIKHPFCIGISEGSSYPDFADMAKINLGGPREYFHAMYNSETSSDPIKYKEAFISLAISKLKKARNLYVFINNNFNIYTNSTSEMNAYAAHETELDHLLGTALHMIQDTFAPPHAARDENTLEIFHIQEYSEQKFHKQYDNREGNEIFYKAAIEATRKILKMFFDKKDRIEDIKTMLINEILIFRSDILITGSEDLYIYGEKKK